jgi:hypothetical protein
MRGLLIAVHRPRARREFANSMRRELETVAVQAFPGHGSDERGIRLDRTRRVLESPQTKAGRRPRAPGESAGRLADRANGDSRVGVRPFVIFVPKSELRSGPWAKHRDKPVVWIPCKREAVEISVFFTRGKVDEGTKRASGWHTQIARQTLIDGRELWILAGDAKFPEDKIEEFERYKHHAYGVAQRAKFAAGHFVITTGPNAEGTRHFIEAACDGR